MMFKNRKLYPIKKPLGGGVQIEVCWRDDRFGKGPCFSIYRNGTEMLRFDLFERDAHWHDYREATQPRHYFDRHRHAVGDHATAKLFGAAIDLAITKYPQVEAQRDWVWRELVARYRREHPATSAT